MATISALDQLLVIANSRHGPGADCGVSTEPAIITHDHLNAPRDARDFLRHNGVAVPPDAPRPAQLRALRRLRESVWTLLERDGLERSARQAGDLLLRSTYRLDLEGRLTPSGRGWDGLIGTALAGLVELRRHHGQLKTCAEASCGWLFVDATRNHSRRWCDMAACGNRAKVRRFLQRRRR